LLPPQIAEARLDFPPEMQPLGVNLSQGLKSSL
jgi:hypothetical protein